MTARVTELLDAMLEKRAIQDRLMGELRVSLALEAFEPRAFLGHMKARIGGTSHAARPWDGEITIYLASGEDVVHKAIDVPFILWPLGMQQEYNAIAPAKRPKLKEFK